MTAELIYIYINAHLCFRAEAVRVPGCAPDWPSGKASGW